jgi:hypothetical protein
MYFTKDALIFIAPAVATITAVWLSISSSAVLKLLNAIFVSNEMLGISEGLVEGFCEGLGISGSDGFGEGFCEGLGISGSEGLGEGLVEGLGEGLVEDIK